MSVFHSSARRLTAANLLILILIFSIHSTAQPYSTGAVINGLTSPLSMFADKAGNIFFTEGNTVHNNSSVVAGTGVAGSSGDGGPAISAELNQPYGLFEDRKGNLYIGTRGDNKIRRVGTDNTISTFAGNGTAGYTGDGGPATAASLAGINGLWGDFNGNIYVSDSIHSVVRKIDTFGRITTIAGTGVLGYSGDGGPAVSAQLGRPNGIGTDPLGNIYIGDDSPNAVRKIDTNGMITTIIGGSSVRALGGDFGPATAATFVYIANIYVNDEGNVFVLDYPLGVVRIYNPNDGTINFFSDETGDFPGSQPYSSWGQGASDDYLASDPVDGNITQTNIFYPLPGSLYSPSGNDTIAVNLLAPPPGQPVTAYYNNWIRTLNDNSYNRIMDLLPSQVGNSNIPKGLHTFIDVDDTVKLFKGVPLMGRHYKILSPPGEDSVNDAIQFWFDIDDAVAYDNYVSANNLNYPPMTEFNPGLEETVLTGNPMSVVEFRGNNGDPANPLSSVEVLIPNQIVEDPGAEQCGCAPTPQFYIVKFTAVHGFGDFYLSTATTVPLPLTLLSFTAVPEGRDAVLSWSTSNEVDTRTFLVQRSMDTTSFATVGSVAAAGTSSGSHSYGYTDRGLAPGSYYYRLQMVDQSGKFTYSPIRSVTIGAGGIGGFVLYPNPAKDVLYCQVGATVAGNYLLQLTDSKGNVLQTRQASLPAGQMTVSFDVADLPSGVYFITVSDGSGKQTAQFLK